MAETDKTPPTPPPTEALPTPVKRVPTCPVCKGPVEVYLGTNLFKLGTGFCATHGRQPLGG